MWGLSLSMCCMPQPQSFSATVVETLPRTPTLDECDVSTDFERVSGELLVAINGKAAAEKATAIAKAAADEVPFIHPYLLRYSYLFIWVSASQCILCDIVCDIVCIYCGAEGCSCRATQ